MIMIYIYCRFDNEITKAEDLTSLISGLTIFYLSSLRYRYKYHGNFGKIEIVVKEPKMIIIRDATFWF